MRGHEDLHVDRHGRVMIWRTGEPGKRPEFDPAPYVPSLADAALMVNYAAAKVSENARRAGFAPGPESVTASYDVSAAGRPSLADEYADMRREDERRAAEKHVASPDPIPPRT